MSSPFAQIRWPHKSDARWALLIFQIAFIFYALNFPSFKRVPEQFFICLFTCLTLDSLFLYIKKIAIIPLSGVISSLGAFLLADSITLWAYFLMAVLTISSKHLLRGPSGHFFNPNNFALIVCILFFEEDITVVAASWGGDPIWPVLIALLGVGVCIAAKKITLAFSYIFTFSLGAYLRSSFAGIPLIIALGPATGAAFQLFVFYMITDPKTTPSERRYQALFGLALGMIDALFRYNENKYAPFLALFILTPFLPIFKSRGLRSLLKK